MIELMIMVNFAPFYDKIDDYGQLCTFLYLNTDPDLCERCYLHDFTYLTGF